MTTIAVPPQGAPRTWVVVQGVGTVYVQDVQGELTPVVTDGHLRIWRKTGTKDEAIFAAGTWLRVYCTDYNATPPASQERTE